VATRARTVLLSAALVSVGAMRPEAPAAKGDRTAVLLAINDVYRIEGLQNGTAGGLARVRTLRLELEREAPDLLMLHGGDFLFPSFASRMYQGQQMVSVMNSLDGNPGAFDKRMFVTLGNHEFDQRRLKDAPLLTARIRESQFSWLGGNVVFAKGGDGKPLVAAKNLTRSSIVESGGLRIGLFGLTIPTAGVEYITSFQGAQEAARELVRDLRARKADVVIALTHLEASEDRRMLEALGDSGPDLVIGGHEHEPVRIEVAGRWILKADAGARSATIARITRKADGSVHVTSELRVLEDEAPKPDPRVQAVVDEWQDRQHREFCASVNAEKDCLLERYGHTRTDLEAEETKIRARETSLGNWVADRMLAAFRSCGARVAFMNSGGLRINGDLPAGGVIIRRHLEELIAYKTPLFLLKIDGSTLAKVADQSVRGWPGSGTWLQIAGFAFRHDTAGRVASSLTWLDAPPRKVLPADEVLAVTPEYLINPDIGDQDGYLMLNRGQVVQGCAANGTELKTLLVRDIRAAEPDGVAPRFEGRICQGALGAPCLALPD
jgi:2',3'-cyclic-nucleotide 2'-phosphodiesterase (5'-nucleotidase family)